VRLHAALVLSFVMLGLSGCGGGDGESGASWDGPPAPAADGSVDVEGFNEFASEVDETWEKAPALAAGEFLRLDTRTASSTSIEAESGPEGLGPTTVTVTLDGLADDSIRSERWELEFASDDGAYRLTQARWAQRCHEGRGHTEFSTEPCV
jgi:hypothetical protein